MSHRINPAILQRLRKEAEGNKDVCQFLEQLIFIEAEHPGQWWWKETYKSIIQKCTEKQAKDAD